MRLDVDGYRTAQLHYLGGKLRALEGWGSRDRIPFYGTVLVEADTQARAEVSAGTWVRSMKQATHGVDMERPTKGKICALDLSIHKEPTDVTESFVAHAEKNRAFREQLDPEEREAGRQNYHVGSQVAWELFEWSERLRKG
jgi:hypothetical protein